MQMRPVAYHRPSIVVVVGQGGRVGQLAGQGAGCPALAQLLGAGRARPAAAAAARLLFAEASSTDHREDDRRFNQVGIGRLGNNRTLALVLFAWD